MKNWIIRNKFSLIQFTFLIPILLVAFVSISHVVTFYGLSNPISWATYLSVAIEIAALASVSALAVGFRKAIYLPFIIVTFIQLIGNVFYSYHYIDVSSELFASWMELINPLSSMMGVDDVAGHRRLLAAVTGGALPIISLLFLHLLVKSTERRDMEQQQQIIQEPEEAIVADKNLPDPAVINQDKLERLEEFLKKKETIEPSPIVDPHHDVVDETPQQSQTSTPQPTPTPTPEPTPSASPTPSSEMKVEEPVVDTKPEPTPEHQTPFTHVGGLLKKVQYNNPGRNISISDV